MEKNMGMEKYIMQMENHTKENGKTTFDKAKAHFLTKIETLLL